MESLPATGSNGDSLILPAPASIYTFKRIGAWVEYITFGGHKCSRVISRPGACAPGRTPSRTTHYFHPLQSLSTIQLNFHSNSYKSLHAAAFIGTSQKGNATPVITTTLPATTTHTS